MNQSNFNTTANATTNQLPPRQQQQQLQEQQRTDLSQGGVGPIQDGIIQPIVGADSSPAEEYSVDQHLQQPNMAALVGAVMGTPSAAATSLLQAGPIIDSLHSPHIAALDGHATHLDITQKDQRRVSNADVLGLIGSGGASGVGGNIANSPRTPSTSMHRLENHDGTPTNQHMQMMMLLGLGGNGDDNTGNAAPTAPAAGQPHAQRLQSPLYPSVPSTQNAFLSNYYPQQQQQQQQQLYVDHPLGSTGTKSRGPREASVSFTRDVQSPSPSVSVNAPNQTLYVMLADGTVQAFAPTDDTMNTSPNGMSGPFRQPQQQQQQQHLVLASSGAAVVPAVGVVNQSGFVLPSRRDPDNTSRASSSYQGLPVPRSPRGASSYMSNMATSGAPMMVSASAPAALQPQPNNHIIGAYFSSPITSGGIAGSPSSAGGASPNSLLQPQSQLQQQQQQPLPSDAAIYFTARRSSYQNQLSYVANASVQQYSEVAMRGSPAPQPSQSHVGGAGTSQLQGSYYLMQNSGNAGHAMTGANNGNYFNNQSYSRAQRELSFFGSTGPEVSHVAATGGDSNDVSIDRAYSIGPVVGFGVGGGVIMGGAGGPATEGNTSSTTQPNQHTDPYVLPQRHSTSQPNQLQMSTTTTTTSHATVSTAPPTYPRASASQNPANYLGGAVLSPTSPNLILAPEPMGATTSSFGTNGHASQEFHHHQVAPTYPTIVGDANYHQLNNLNLMHAGSPHTETMVIHSMSLPQTTMQNSQFAPKIIPRSPQPAAMTPYSSNSALPTPSPSTQQQPLQSAANKPMVLYKKIDASGKNLFVSGLHPYIEHKRLKAIFSAYGPVNSTRVLYDTSEPTKSKGMGFVHFEEHSSVDVAIKTLNGARLNVDIPRSEVAAIDPSVADPNISLTASSLPGEESAYVTVSMTLQVKLADDDATFIPEETNKLFIRNVPRSITTMQLWTYFRRFGNVLDCSIHKDISARGRLEQSTLNMAYVTYSSIAEASRTLDITNNTIPWSNDRYFNIPESVEGTTAAERAAALLANSPSGTTALNSLYFGEQHNGGHEVFAGNLQRRNEVRRTALANLRAHLKTTGRTLKQVGRTPLTPSEEQHNTFSSSPSQSGSPRNLTATGSNAGTLREVTLQDLSIDELFMVYDAADDEDGEDAVVRQLSEAIGLLFTSNVTPRDQAMEMLARLARNFPAATRTVQASNLGIVASSGRGRGGVGNNNSLTITIRPIIVKPAETLLCRTMRMQKLQKGGGGGGGGHAQQPHSGAPHTQSGRGEGANGGGRGGGGNFLPQVPNYQQQQQHQPPMPFPHNNGLLHNPPHGAMPQNPTPFFNVPPRLQQQQQHQQFRPQHQQGGFGPPPINSSGQFGNSNRLSTDSSEAHSTANNQHFQQAGGGGGHQQFQNPMPYNSNGQPASYQSFAPVAPSAAGMSPLTPNGPSYGQAVFQGQRQQQGGFQGYNNNSLQHQQQYQQPQLFAAQPEPQVAPTHQNRNPPQMHNRQPQYLGPQQHTGGRGGGGGYYMN